MMQYILSAMTALSAACATAAADDYLVQVELTGFADRPANEPESPDLLLGRIETVARLGVPFFARTTIGKETLGFQGELTARADGRFHLEILFRRTIDNGVEVPVGNGRRQKILDESSANTSLVVDLDKPILMGCLATEARSGDPTAIPVLSRERRTVRVVKFKPADN